MKTPPLTAGSFSVWKVDLRQSDPKVDKTADLTDAAFLNGIVALNLHAVLIADAKLGVVFLLDTYTGKYGIVLGGETMKSVPGALVQSGLMVRRHWAGICTLRTPLLRCLCV